jgi:hypothetical protein
MLYLLGGRYGTPIRLLLGLVLVVLGIVTHGPIWVALGAGLIVWGAARGLRVVRSHRVGS